MSNIINLKDKIESCCAVSAGILMILMSGIAIWQVFSRYVLNSPSTSTEELLRYLMIWMGYLGAAYCFGKNNHLSITLLENKLKNKKYYYLKFLQLILTTLVIIVVGIYGGIYFVTSSIEQTSPSLRISMSIVYSIIPISGILIVTLIFCNITILIREIRGK